MERCWKRNNTSCEVVDEEEKEEDWDCKAFARERRERRSIEEDEREIYAIGFVREKTADNNEGY